MKLSKILAILAVTMVASIASAAEDFQFNVSTTFMSKYLWHGHDVYDDRTGMKTTLGVVSEEMGAYANVSYIMPNAGGSAYKFGNGDAMYSIGQSDEWDFTVGVMQTLMEDDMLQMNADLSYTYYAFGDAASYKTVLGNKFKTADFSGEDRDLQELALDIKFPNVFGDAQLVPHYKLAYIFEAGGYGDDTLQPAPMGDGVNYFEHTLGLMATMNVEDLPVYASVDVVYDGGRNDLEDSGFKRVVYGLSTEMEMGPGKLIPAVCYQWDLDDSIYDLDDEWVATLTYSIDF